MEMVCRARLNHSGGKRLNLCWKILQYSPCDVVERNTYNVFSVKSREVATIHESYIIIAYTAEKEALKGLLHSFATALVWEQNLSDLNYINYNNYNPRRGLIFHSTVPDGQNSELATIACNDQPAI